MNNKNIAIFASGSGTNAENIIKYFERHQSINVTLILTNNPTAGVISRAKKLQVPVFIFNRNDFYENGAVLQELIRLEIDLIVLAGFLWLVPKSIISHFNHRIINIHPALLPKFGGKGMYGARVHEAVIKNQESFTGITIHYVNEAYDEGSIILQKSIPINTEDTADSIALKVHRLEYEYYPKVIEKLIAN